MTYSLNSNITGIIVALPEEVSTLTPQKIVKGEIYRLNPLVLIAYFGSGFENAQCAARALIKEGAVQLISWGCAAALDVHLKSGDLILPEYVIGQNKKYSVSLEWLNSIKHLYSKQCLPFSVYHGDLVESKIIVSSITDKYQLYQQTGAIAVDMESYAVAEIADAHNFPFLIIRSIADTAQMALPSAVMESINEQGDVVLSKLLLNLVKNPFQLLELIRLGISFQAAKNTLTWFGKQLFKN